MPETCAPTSEPCSARSARPAGDSIRLSASHTAASSAPPTTQYQARSPAKVNPNSVNAGTLMPSGPPVRPSSVTITIEMMMPMPSVAMAR